MSRWRGNPWAILLTLSLGFFMTLLDLTIVNIAIPSMTEKLDASLDQILWIVNAYILVLAVLLISGGRLGDLWGKKNLFIAGVALFTLASLVCGIAQDPAQLIAARAVQGLGAALLMPQTMSIIINVFPPDRRGAALGIWGAVAGVSTIAGPTIGGLLVTSFDWRWIFFVNLPIGILVLAMAIPILPSHTAGVRHRFDVPGVLLASAALFCLVFGLTEGEKFGWDARIWGLLAAGAVLFAVFAVHQRGRQDREPLVPFSLFRDRNFSILTLVGAAVSIGMIGMVLPLTIYMQSVLGFSALKAGLVMAPSSVVSMFLAPLAGRLSDRFGGKFILMSGLTLYAIGMLWTVSIADVGTDWTSFIAPLVIVGLGIGCVFAPMATEATRNVPPHLAAPRPASTTPSGRSGRCSAPRPSAPSCRTGSPPPSRRRPCGAPGNCRRRPRRVRRRVRERRRGRPGDRRGPDRRAPATARGRPAGRRPPRAGPRRAGVRARVRRRDVPHDGAAHRGDAAGRRVLLRRQAPPAARRARRRTRRRRAGGRRRPGRSAQGPVGARVEDQRRPSGSGTSSPTTSPTTMV
ncbi:DHA2 family efflux MFS transporter permease subunit [Actinomadura sp. CNU-125]|uniref:DHA2 family efflux MFS transporter permease subunit n=1 Tax=Actinomadura sp. CNU-125 TaxID=1904961 RepID=UPI000AB8BCAF|nr:DHA2 family efflux MFS transporter permease subunit [Actinomadura sp. CNU-125]